MKTFFTFFWDLAMVAAGIIVICLPNSLFGNSTLIVRLIGGAVSASGLYAFIRHLIQAIQKHKKEKAVEAAKHSPKRASKRKKK